MTRDSLQTSLLSITLICLSLLLRVCNTAPSYFGFDMSTTSLIPTTNGFKLKGYNVGSNQLGRSVRTAGDINKDGYDDFIVGAFGYSSSRGITYVIYGGETSSFVDFDFSSGATLDPHTTGFVIIGNANSDLLGWSASTAGDVNGDGYDDIVVGAYGKYTQTGIVYVIYGGEKLSMRNINFATDVLDPGSTGFTITGASISNYFGFSVSTAGDINKDGYDDIIVGAHGKNSDQGAAYVIYGGQKASMSNILLSSALDPLTKGFIITETAASDYFGFSVSTAGDINKDGYDDIVIGAMMKNSFQGAAYVIYGGEKASLSNIILTSLNPSTTGFIITGQNTGDKMGFSVSTAGDINNDGYDDIIVGASDKSSQAGGFVGAAYMIYGGEKSSMSHLDFSSGATLNPATTGFMIKGNAASDYFGAAVSMAGDLNKDGYDDIIVGAFGKSSSQGAAYVIYGGKTSSMSNLDLSIVTLNPLTTGFKITGKAASNFGFSVSTAGDINNDGYKDIIIGAYAEGSAGTAYVIHTACSPCWNCQTNCDICPSSPTICTDCTNPFLLYQSQCFSTCPSTTYTSVDTCEDCPTKCKECSSPSICTECKNPYLLHQLQCLSTCPPTTYASTGICKNCPTNCNQCSSDTLCTECTSPYLLYKSECVSTCPLSTITSSGKCQDCPANCYACNSTTSCEVCSPGYILSNSLCIAFSYQQAQEKASQAISSATQALGSVVCVGSVTFPVTALVSTIVQNTRYLNLSVSTDLSEIYKTWNTDLISWDVPNVISDFDHFKTSPPLFSQYGLGSSFLSNFWPTLVNIGIGLATFITCYVLKRLFELSEYNKGWVYSLLQKLILGSFNFTLIQAYACMDNILFYLVIDAKTNPFNSFFSWTSLISASVFLALGCLLVFFNFWTVKRYQRIKNQNVKDLDAFNEKNKYWELFYSDFNEDDLLGQSFFAFLIIRSTLSSFIVTVLYDYPLMQTSFLITLDAAIIGFLFLKNPFKAYRGTLCQYYFEIITLLVHICTFILSFQDSLQSSSDTLRTVLSTGIIYLNTALVSGSIGFMFIEIYKTMSEKRKAGKLKHSQNISVPEENQETQNLTNSPLQHSEPSAPKRQNWLNTEQETSPENLHYFSGIHQNNQNTSILRINMEPSQFHFESNLNAENSVFSDMNTSHMINEPRGISPQPILIRRRPHIMRHQQQRNGSMMINNTFNNEQFENF